MREAFNSFTPTLRTIALASVAFLLAGCTSLAPVYERPSSPTPEKWTGANQAVGHQSAAATLPWQAFVTDAELRALVERALAHNRDLRQALLNVQAAQAMYRVQDAERLPGIQAEGSASRQRLPRDLRSPGTPSTQSRYQAGLGLAAYEIDLFGRVRDLSTSALQEFLATEEAAYTVRVSLVAEVIQAYLTRQGAQQRQQLSLRTQEARQHSLRLIEQRRTLGAATDLDVQEALGLVHQVDVELERVDREARWAGNALSLLVGDADRAPLTHGDAADRQPLVQDLSAGMPSELLAHRPDIRAAEHRLQARHADIGAARAAFFPRITLTGGFGTASSDLGDLFNGGQRVWSFLPQLTLPIFDGGRNQANLDLALVRKDMAIVAYEHTIQTAFREVADALAATDTLRREETAQQALARSSSEALRLTQSRWLAGADDHLRFLDAQRSDLAVQMALIQVKTQRQIALATLFRALGGGWVPTVPPVAMAPNS